MSLVTSFGAIGLPGGLFLCASSMPNITLRAPHRILGEQKWNEGGGLVAMYWCFQRSIGKKYRVKVKVNDPSTPSYSTTSSSTKNDTESLIKHQTPGTLPNMSAPSAKDPAKPAVGPGGKIAYVNCALNRHLRRLTSTLDTPSTSGRPPEVGTRNPPTGKPTHLLWELAYSVSQP